MPVYDYVETVNMIRVIVAIIVSCIIHVLSKKYQLLFGRTLININVKKISE